MTALISSLLYPSISQADRLTFQKRVSSVIQKTASDMLSMEKAVSFSPSSACFRLEMSWAKEQLII
jgi:hypothetical protein